MMKRNKNITTILIAILCNLNLFSQQVGHTTFTYTDASRNNRQITTEVYYPASSSGNNAPISAGVFPLVVCGHGFVMTWSAYENIWTALVPEGYIVAFPTTENGFSPVHSDFGLDLKFLVTEIQNIGAGPSVPNSSVGNTSAIMGHSMGGGSSFLAAANNNFTSTMISFAAANTNPSSITAATKVSVPTLLFSGANDCVTPPAQHQDIMYDSTSAAYKTQVYITGGGHCYFAENNLNCSFGEATCSPSPTITRLEQQNTMSDFMKMWLSYFLKGDCNKAQEFQDSLVASQRITYRQSQSIACPTAIVETNAQENNVSVFPNPTFGNITVQSKLEELWQIIIYDLEGRKVFGCDFKNKSTKEIIDISMLKKGTYFLKINTHNHKIVITH